MLLKHAKKTTHTGYVAPFEWTKPLSQKVLDYYDQDFEFLGYSKDPQDLTLVAKAPLAEGFPVPIDAPFYTSACPLE